MVMSTSHFVCESIIYILVVGYSANNHKQNWPVGARSRYCTRHEKLSPIQIINNTVNCKLHLSNVLDGDEQVAVDLAEFQRAAEILQSQRGLSALSLEEQKLLQSLDRLNHRLQCKFHPFSLELVRTGIVLYIYDIHAILGCIQSSIAELIIRW